MRRTWSVIVPVSAAALSLAACAGNAPRPAAESQPYKIVSELADPASSSNTVMITLPGSSTPVEIKAAAESIIASRRGKFAHVTVKSFLEGASLDGVPLAVSKYDGAAVDHVFTGLSPPSQRIPTH